MSGETTSYACFHCGAGVDPVRVAVRIRAGSVVRLCGFCLIAEREIVDEAHAARVGISIEPRASLSDNVALPSWALSPGETAPGETSPSETLSTARSSSKASSGTISSSKTTPGKSSRRASTLSELTELIESQLGDLQRRSRGGNRVAGIGIIAIALLPVVAYALAFPESSGRTQSIGEEGTRPVSRLIALDSDEIVFTELEPEPLVSGEDWLHPIAGTDEKLPTAPSRLFRAERPGDRPRECGRGHCGIDLDSPRGSPIVAVRPGVVESAVRDRNRSGGRYVWILHEDVGLRTEYFHLDEVTPGLSAGDQVVAGQWLGTLGKTGIENSEPHLHFAVRDIERGHRYLDPTPWLTDAEIISILDLRVFATSGAEKSASPDPQPAVEPDLDQAVEPGE